MAGKFKQAAAKGDNQFVQSVRESAQQIWLAGLGAFSKAQDEGGKVFETLVKEGEGLHKKTRGIAEAKMAEVSGNFSKAAGRAQSAANQTWDKLEQVFEDRVGRALKRMGVPTSAELAALSKRIDALSPKSAPRKAATAKKAGARKTAAKKAVK